jgi:hypothetical protein
MLVFMTIAHIEIFASSFGMAAHNKCLRDIIVAGLGRSLADVRPVYCIIDIIHLRPKGESRHICGSAERKQPGQPEVRSVNNYRYSTVRPANIFRAWYKYP